VVDWEEQNVGENGNFRWERNLGKFRGVNSNVCLLLKNKQKVVA
jgi:hypothetical protein